MVQIFILIVIFLITGIFLVGFSLFLSSMPRDSILDEPKFSKPPEVPVDNNTILKI